MDMNAQTINNLFFFIAAHLMWIVPLTGIEF